MVGEEVREKAADSPRKRERQEVVTALVNGRTVRMGTKINNGDVLSCVSSSSLNSGSWVGRGAEKDGQEEADEVSPGEEAAPLMPWPWSLVGSANTEDTVAWYVEAERKHGRVAFLALINWLALASSGQVSLSSEPLGSLAIPVASYVWALQAGGIAVYESLQLDYATSEVLHAEQSDGAPREDPLALQPFAALNAIDNLPAYELLLLIQLWLGRASMVAMLGLALNADQRFGLLHDFETGIGSQLPRYQPELTVSDDRRKEEARLAASSPGETLEDVAALFPTGYQSLAGDVVLQDIRRADMQ